ncbi:MAG TPA: hypothetical protein VIS48_00355 [Candidatus Kryptonia bacterium]
MTRRITTLDLTIRMGGRITDFVLVHDTAEVILDETKRKVYLAFNILTAGMFTDLMQVILSCVVVRR